MNLRTLSEPVELSVSLWAFGDFVGPRSVCESSVYRTSVTLWAFIVGSVEPSVSLKALRKSVGPH